MIKRNNKASYNTKNTKTIIFHSILIKENLKNIPPDIPSQVFFVEFVSAMLLLTRKLEKITEPLSVCQDAINHKLKKPKPGIVVANGIIKLRGKVKKANEKISAQI